MSSRPHPPASDSAPSQRLLVVSPDAARWAGVLRGIAPLSPIDVVADADVARETMESQGVPSPYRLVLLEIGRAAEAPALLAAIRGRAPATELVVLAGEESLELSLAAMRSGARDVISASMAESVLAARVASLLASAPLACRGGTDRREPDALEAVSETWNRTVSVARRIARLPTTVLLTGETGTGKEVVAELIHRESAAPGPLVRVNCAALPETLLESELFGHERGAFTGADQRHIGRFEQARRGTLLLDEVGELAPSTQVKLLRVLQQREFQRLGGTETLPTDARIIAATNCDLAIAMSEGTFREDLYFRLNVVGIHLAPLRERPEDIPALAERFLDELCATLGEAPRTLTPAALAALCSAPWPGNVRQLRNTLERAIVTSTGTCLDALDLAEPAPWAADAPTASEGAELSLAAAERAVVVRALDRSGYVQKDAARLLGVSRRKLNYMIRRMGLTHPSWRRNRPAESGVEASPDAAGLPLARSDVY